MKNWTLVIIPPLDSNRILTFSQYAEILNIPVEELKRHIRLFVTEKLGDYWAGHFWQWRSGVYISEQLQWKIQEKVRKSHIVLKVKPEKPQKIIKKVHREISDDIDFFNFLKTYIGIRNLPTTDMEIILTLLAQKYPDTVALLFTSNRTWPGNAHSFKKQNEELLKKYIWNVIFWIGDLSIFSNWIQKRMRAFHYRCKHVVIPTREPADISV